VCVDDDVPLTQSDLRFSRNAKQLFVPTSAGTVPSIENHPSFTSDSESETNSSASHNH